MKIAYETFIRGTTTADDNRFETAVGKLEAPLEINPSYSGYINLADIYDEIGDVEAALRASQKAADSDKTNPSPILSIGMFLKDKGNLDEAEEYLLKAQSLFDSMELADDEFQVTLWVNLGNVYYEKAEAATGEDAKIAWAQKAIDDCYGEALKLREELRISVFWQIY